MTYIESPTETVTKFIPSWRYAGRERLRDEIESAFNETHRKPDKYKFKFKNGNLVDYKTDTEININTSTYLGRKDSELLTSLTSWVSENSDGTAIWISPSYGSAYPCNKITTYSLTTDEAGEKSTFNVTVLFDTPKSHTIEIASRLNPAFSHVNNPEVLRNKLFVVDEKFDLKDLLELIGIKGNELPAPSYELVEHFVDLIYSGMDPRTIAMEMEKRGIVGENSVSCGGGTVISSLEGNSLVINLSGLEDKYGSLFFSCPKCGSINTRPFGHLISSCQHCGGDVRC